MNLKNLKLPSLKLPKRIPHFSPALALLVGMMWLAWLGYQLVSQAPRVKVLESLRLSPPTEAGTPLVLGWEALGQDPHAGLVEKQHVQARFEPGKGWQLANVATHRQVAVTGADGQAFELRRVKLQANDVIQLGKQALKVKALTPHLLLENADLGLQARWDGNSLQRNTPNYAGCPAAWKQSTYLPVAIRRYLSAQTFSLGGAVQCHDRLSVADVPFKTASITQVGNDYYLRPLLADVAVALVRDGQPVGFQPFETPAKDVRSAIIGRTAYDFRQEGDCKVSCDLLLTAQTATTRPVFAADTALPELPAQITAAWGSQQWVGGLGTVASPHWKQWLLLAGLLLVTWWATWVLSVWRADLLNERKRWQIRGLLGVPVLAFWLGAVWLEGLLAWQMALAWLSWGAASWVLYRQGSLRGAFGGLWLVMVLLAGLGGLTQVQLAAGADNTRYLRFPVAHWQFLLGVPVLVSAVGLTPVSLLQRAWAAVQQSRLRWWALGLLLLVLLLQWVLGDETGLGVVQPVELAKTVLVLLLAGFVLNWQELTAMDSTGFKKNRVGWLGHFLKALLLGLVTVVMVAKGVHDFSPILIVSGLLLVYGWLLLGWRGKILLVVLVVAILLGGVFIQQNPAWIDAGLGWFPQTERLHIWAQPWQYPDSGYQLQRALQAINHNGQGWWGTGWFGGNDARVMGIPAVQNDFILAFFLHKAGGVAGLVLLGLCLVWLGLLFRLARGLLQAATPWERKHKLPARFLAYSLYGLAWMQAFHWLIAWGNALGVLPIMGQPMTWVSSGNSHLLAVALPTLVLALLAGQLQVRGK